MKGMTQFGVETNLLFALVDVMETLLMDMEQEMLRHGRGLHYSLKRYFNQAMHGVRGVKAEVKHIAPDAQEAFGYDADILYALLVLTVDRTGEDDMEAFKLYNYLKAMPSRHHLEPDIDEASVFGHVLQGKGGQ